MKADRPTVEGVSEERLRNLRAWAAARVGSLSGADITVAAVDELLAFRDSEKQVTDDIYGAHQQNELLRQQLAEMRGKLEPHSKWLHLAAERLQKQQRDYSIANTCEEAADAIDAALAPTSQPSRGKCETGAPSDLAIKLFKEMASKCENCDGKGRVRANSYDLTMVDCHECAEARSFIPPDCAQPERQTSGEA